VRRPSVTIILNSGTLQACLPSALSREGLLRTAVRMAPDLEILEPDTTGSLQSRITFRTHRAGNRVFWAIWRRVPLGWRKYIPLVGWSALADDRLARHLSSSDIFQGVVGVSLASLRRAKAAGAITLIDCTTLHQTAFEQEVRIDSSDAGVSPDDGEHLMSRSAIRRCELQYELCDRIIVYSAAAQRSFDRFAYAGKTVVVHPGVDHDFFQPEPGRRRTGTFHVCYVGRIEAAKGIHHLLAAWKQLALQRAKLTLIGRVPPSMERFQAEWPSSVDFAGILSAEQVAEQLRKCDLFVLPSANEGLSLAILEAMSSGVPVVACQGTGADDCIHSGKEGLLVQARDRQALADAVLWCYQHPEHLGEMGKAARMRIEEQFTLSHYQRRLIHLYETLYESAVKQS